MIIAVILSVLVLKSFGTRLVAGIEFTKGCIDRKNSLVFCVKIWGEKIWFPFETKVSFRIFNAFTNHCAYIGTVIYPTYKLGSASPEGNFAGRAMQNEYLKSKAKEAITYAYGTKVLTFPYEIGTSITLPETVWKYNNNTLPKWKETIKQ